jgi:GntR family transcriptional regulator, transcriptional repressor for pyruvate dehydrogenase complex
MPMPERNQVAERRNQVAERVQSLLEEGHVRPGDRLPPERRLAAELGVSRSTLREGLRRLIDLGIVEARQGSGTYVAPLDLDDLLDVRLQLEPYAARLAAGRRSEQDLARLDATLAELRAHEDDPAAFAAADARLHQAVTDAAGSVALRVLLAALADLLRRSRDTTASDPAVRGAALAELERLVDAIRAGDGPAAERAMRAHLRDVGAALPRRRPEVLSG